MDIVKDDEFGSVPSQTTSFLDLSDDLTTRILLRLKPREIAVVALTCKRLAVACADDARVWQQLCASTWGPFTKPERWLQPDLSPAGPERLKHHREIPRLARPAFLGKDDDDDDDGPIEEGQLTTFRSVFAAMRRVQPLIGLWRGAGDAPRGSLFRVSFAPGGAPHLEVVALRARNPGDAGAAGGGPGGGGGDGADDAAAEAEAEAAAAVLVEEVTARVGPGFPGCVLQLVDESFALLKDEPWKREVRRGPGEGPGGNAGGHAAAGAGAAGGSGRPSAAALAAAAVATGGRGGAELLGASPPRSFEYEVLRFMETHVAGSRSGGRKVRNRGGGGGGGPGASPGPFGAPRQPIILKHLVRLQLPAPSRQRPLCGLWTGVYGPHGLEVVSVAYEGRGAGSRIVATKVTGDPNVPAGEVTWRVNAEPLPQPWPLHEVELITNRPLYASDRPGALAAALAAAAAEAAEAAAPPRQPPPGVMVLPVWAIPGVAAAVQAAINDGGEENVVHGPIAERLAAVAAAAAAADPVDLWDYLGPMGPPPQPAAAATPPSAAVPEGPPRGPVARRQPARVVAVYRGEGRVAGTNFTNPAWIEGRLWVYDNGSIGFVWCREVGFLVDFERMSPQLMGRTPGPSGTG